MKLTVLGKFGPYPQPGGCCSGYLIEDGNTTIALELGCGAMSRLLQYKSLGEIDALVLSHWHYDHCGDVPILQYALEQGQRENSLPLYASEEGLLLNNKVFERNALIHGEKFTVGALQITVFGVQHSVCGFGILCEDSHGKKLFYTGDTRYFKDLADYGAGVNVLLADTCLLSDPESGVKFHLTAAEAGRLARESGVNQLLCTHILGGGCNEQELLARTGFSKAAVVQEHMTYLI